MTSHAISIPGDKGHLITHTQSMDIGGVCFTFPHRGKDYITCIYGFYGSIFIIFMVLYSWFLWFYIHGFYGSILISFDGSMLIYCNMLFIWNSCFLFVCVLSFPLLLVF